MRKVSQGKWFEDNFNLHPDDTNGIGLQDVPLGPSNATTFQKS
jgi:hypothetical protein